MPPIDDLLNHYRNLAAQMRDDLIPLESGQTIMRENDGTGWVDITQDWIDETKRRIKNLENIIAAYEKRNA